MSDDLRAVLAAKGAIVHSIAPEASVADAVALMNEARVGAVLVSEGDTPVGIFTERDVLRRVVARGRDASKTGVSEVMTRELVVVKPSLSVEDAMAVVSNKRCRHLPVVEGGRVVGMVSIGDLTHWATRDREIQIQRLVEYVTGQYPT